MNTSPQGRELITRFEGCKLTAYRDIGGVLTIGIGHTGKDVFPGQEITEAEADALLAKDLIRTEHYVNALVEVPLNQNQFDALVSFTFNLGSGALQESTLLKLLNNGEYSAAQAQFKRWDMCAGRHIEGLMSRRVTEAELFGSPV